MWGRNNPSSGRSRSAPAPLRPRRRAAAPAKRCSIGISWSFLVSSVWFLAASVARLVPTSMRKRVEFPVSLDLPPAMREPVGLEHQEADDDQPDRDLAQEGDVVVERQRLVDGRAFQAGADPFHRFR